MYTINELLNMRKIEQQTRASIMGEIDSLQRRAAEMKATMDKALEDGAADEYGKAAFAVKSIQMQIDRQQEQLKKTRLYTDDNVLDAWKEFALDYNVQFAAALAEYEAARYELAHKFRDLMTMQGKAQLVRAEMDRLLHQGDADLHITFDNRLAPLDTIPNDQQYRVRPVGSHNAALVDAVFFCQHDDIPRARYSDMAQIADGAPIDPTKPALPLSPWVRAFSGYNL